MENIDKKTIMEVSAIENGTVIDHIPSQHLFDVMKILKLKDINNRITFGTNLESKRIGTKALIKISDIYLDEKAFDSIAPLASKARMSYIKNFKVEKKIKIEIPDIVEGNIACANPMCITNQQNIKTKFRVKDKENCSLECVYCEKTTLKSQFKVKL